MAPITQPSHLANPLASSAQLEISASHLDGVPRDLEDSVRFETARLLQAAGILLRLPQELVAHSIVLLYRFWIGPDGGSMLEYDSKVRDKHSQASTPSPDRRRVFSIVLIYAIYRMLLPLFYIWLRSLLRSRFLHEGFS